jgi:hypothetical protein
MKLRLTLLTVAIVAVGLVLTGCEHNGALFGGAGALAGGKARAAGASNSEAVAIGLATGAAVGQTAYTIAKHEATERQRRTAEARAHLAYQDLSPERKARVKKNRYIVVDTVREKDSQGAKSVMIYDTQTQQVVGSNVYDVKQSPKGGTSLQIEAYPGVYVGSGDNGVTPTPSPIAQATPTPTTQATLPTFFPPKATATVPVPLHLIKGGISLGELAERLGRVMDSVGYVEKSFYSLDAVDNKGCAIVTHIEQIKADGTPVAKGRWSFELPSYENFSVQTFLAALFTAQPGYYRLIALVVSEKPLVEKQNPPSPSQAEELIHGPKSPPLSLWTIPVTSAYRCIAYIYEFERPTRSHDPAFMKDSPDVTAQTHLASTGLWTALQKEY